MNIESSSKDADTSESANSDEPPKVTQRAERIGLGALLAGLRGDNIAKEFQTNLSTHCQEPDKNDAARMVEEERNEEVVESSSEEPPRPMNRREKRKLQKLQALEGGEAKKPPLEVLKPAELPTGLKRKYCDNETFNSYTANFGYESTRNNNFVHFCLQNMNGTRAIVASQDRYIRMYDIDKECVLWKHNTGGLILDSYWENSGKGVFSTSRLRPIQLFDADNGAVIGAYNGKDSGDNITEAMCIGQAGNTLIGGFRNQFQIWDVDYTGNALSVIKSFDKNYSSGFSGVAMSVDCHPTMHDLFASAGSSPIISTYSINWKSSVSTIEGSHRGYTNIHFSSDGMKLYASERKGDIHCFDTRMNLLTQVLKRNMSLAHRTRFDIDPTGRILFSGTSSGDVIIYDLHDHNEEIQPVFVEKVASTCVPCVSVRNDKLVLCSGQREFPDDEENREYNKDNSFQVFAISTQPENA